jgi:hypothetical protein
MSETQAFYFGCKDRPGHYLFGEDESIGRYHGRSYRDWRGMVDGIFPPRSTQKQGAAAIHFVHGCTVLSFWDYSVDSRPGSNSTFFIPGKHNFDSALAEAQKRFPWVFARMKPTDAVYDAEEFANA